MRCTHCGAMIGPTDPQCRGCGAVVGSGTVAPPPTAPTPPVPFGSGPAGPSPYPTGGQPSAAPVDPWAVPPPGTEWSIPGTAHRPGLQPPAQPYGYPVARSAGSAYSIAGIICGAVALVFCPIVLGIIGLVLASQAKKRGESLAGVARTVSLVGLVAGMVIGALMAMRYPAF